MKLRIYYDYNYIVVDRVTLVKYLLDEGWEEESLQDLTDEELVATINETFDLDQFSGDFDDNGFIQAVRLELDND